MPITLFHSARLEELADILVDRLPMPGDRAVPVQVVVGSRAIERWLRHRIAEKRGICANISFPFPADAVAAVLGRPDLVSSQDKLLFAALAALPPLLDRPAFAEVRGWLEPSGPGSWRVTSLALQIAAVFDRYVAYRTDLLETWTAGADADWQAELWRAVAPRVGWRPIEIGQPLPDVIAVFGTSSLPPAWIRWLDACATVDLYTTASALPGEHLLVASCAVVARDHRSALSMAALAPVAAHMASNATVLRALQADIVSDRAPTTSALPPCDSVQLHACHGPLRQVEVLRDVLLGLFDAHRDLEPRDVLVLTPDPTAFAPLIGAIFDQGRAERAVHGGVARTDADAWGPAGGPQIPVYIADLGLRSTNPVADVLLTVLEMANRRVTASGLADLFARPVVQRRFGFGAEHVEAFRAWLASSGIRWGIDADDRASVHQPADAAFTIRRGLERLALGVTMADDDVVLEGLVPVDDLEGGETVLVGRFAACVETVLSVVAAVRPPRSVRDWTRDLVSALPRLARTSSAGAWLTEQVVQTIDELAAAADSAGHEGDLSLDAVWRLLAGRFDNPRRGDRPVTGAVTIGALALSRVVPARVIVLLGMDDGAFPRTQRGPGFDLLRCEPRPGDPDPAREDRQAFLDAVLAASDHLVVLYTGRDMHTNQTRPPCVPVSELMDVLDAMSPGRGVAQNHPLQPFSPMNFRAAAPASFHRRMRAAATALAGGSAAVFDPFSDPLPPVDLRTVPPDDLIAFFRNAPKYLLNRRLGIWLDDRGVDVEDREPTQIAAGLSRWGLVDRMLQVTLPRFQRDGRVDWDDVFTRLSAEGLLPLGTAGRVAFDEPSLEVGAILDLARPALAEEPSDGPLEVDVDGIRIVGAMRGMRGGKRVSVVGDQPDKPRYLMTAWLETLAFAAATGRDAQADIYGWEKGTGSKPGKSTSVRLAVAGTDASTVLASYVEMFRAGQRRPIRCFEKTSWAFAEVLNGQTFDLVDKKTANKALSEACKAWEGGMFPGDSAEQHIAIAFPGGDGLMTEEAPHDEFVDIAERVWGPIARSLGAGSTS